jgi:serine/threonine protein kinase
MMPLKPGQTFAGRYRIERLLAEGGMGAVFVAEQQATEMHVALKVLWPHVLSSESAVERFQTEAKVAARVNSEHIVRVLDAGFDEETRLPFMVMELLSGESLEELIRHSGPRSLEETVLYIGQTALALDKSHRYVDRDGVQRPIVHRDLKPENLFLTHRESGDPIVKVLDFGIAKVLRNNTDVSQDVKGTPLYMAVEQATGELVTPQTDIWALGLVAYYLLTGRSYWKSASHTAGSLSALMAEVLSMPLDPPSERARETGVEPTFPVAFDAWFHGCVNRHPLERFASAGEAADALSRALLGRSWSVPPVAVTVSRRSGDPVPATRSPESLVEERILKVAEQVQTSPTLQSLTPDSVTADSGDAQISGLVSTGSIPKVGLSPRQLLVVGGAVVAVGLIAAVLVSFRGDPEPAPAVAEPQPSARAAISSGRPDRGPESAAEPEAEPGVEPVTSSMQAAKPPEPEASATPPLPRTRGPGKNVEPVDVGSQSSEAETDDDYIYGQR